MAGIIAQVGARGLSEEEIILRKEFSKEQPMYLQGYIDSYQDNRSFLRRFLEDKLGASKPIRVRAAKAAYLNR